MKVSVYLRDLGTFTGVVYENLTNVKVKGNSLVCDQATFSGMDDTKFVLLNDDEEFLPNYEDAKLLCKTGMLEVSLTMEQRIKELEEQVASLTQPT